MCILSTSDADGGESSSCDECKGIPLTTLPSLEWEEAAVEMYKVCADTQTHRHMHMCVLSSNAGTNRLVADFKQV